MRPTGASPPPSAVLQPVYEHAHFVTGELAGRLALGESHGAPGIAGVGMTGVVQQGQQLLDLLR